jgi:hypothetical protein
VRGGGFGGSVFYLGECKVRRGVVCAGVCVCVWGVLGCVCLCGIFRI